MRNNGVDKDDMMDYVKNATKNYGAVFKTRSHGLSNIKVSEKDIAVDAENAR